MQSYYVDQNMNTNKLQISSDFLSLALSVWTRTFFSFFFFFFIFSPCAQLAIRANRFNIILFIDTLPVLITSL